MTINKNLPVYEQADGEFWAAIFRDERQNSSGIISRLGEGEVTRHRGPIRTIQGKMPLDQEAHSIIATTRINHDLVRATDIAAYISEIRKTGQSLIKQQSIDFFNSLNQISDHPNSLAPTIDLNKTEEEDD